MPVSGLSSVPHPGAASTGSSSDGHEQRADEPLRPATTAATVPRTPRLCIGGSVGATGFGPRGAPRTMGRCPSPPPSTPPRSSSPSSSTTTTASCPPSCRTRAPAQVLMMAWMNAETLRMSLAEGRTVFWSRSRQEVWRKGDTSGDRQFVRSAVLRLRRRHAAVRGRAGGQGRLPHRRAHLLLPVLRVTLPARPRGVPGARPRRTRSSRCGARCWATSPRRSPRSPASSATSPASCSSRWSTASGGAAGRSSAATRSPRSPPAAARSRSAGTLPDGVPLDRGILAARRGGARPPGGPRPSTTSRRCTAGSSATSATTSCARSSTCPNVPPDDLGHPDAVVSVIGQLAAYDHWRQRVTLIDNVLVEPGLVRRGARRPLRRRGRRASTQLAARRQPRRSTSRSSSRPIPTRRCPRSRSTMGAEAYCRAVEVAKEHILAGDIFQVVAGPAVRPRPRRRAVRRLPGAAPGEPEPVHVLRAPAGPHPRRARRPSRWCSCSTAR